VKKQAKILFFFCLGATFAAELSLAQEQETAAIRRQVWHVGLTYNRFHFTADHDVTFNRGNLGVNLGTGYIGQNWLGLASVNIILGPYETVSEDAVNLDYSGTGISFLAAYSLNSDGLRAAPYAYGLFAGLDYLDIIGRSVGITQRRLARSQTNESGLEERESVRDFINQVYNFSLIAGLVVANLKPARAAGNHPSLLSTRSEGVILLIGAGLPLHATFRSRYDRLLEGGDIERVNRRGHFKGYTYYLSIVAPLGV